MNRLRSEVTGVPAAPWTAKCVLKAALRVIFLAVGQRVSWRLKPGSTQPPRPDRAADVR